MDWQLAHDEDLVASGTYRLATCGCNSECKRETSSLEEGAGPHERERRAHQTSGREAHDEPVVTRSEEGAQHWCRKRSDELEVEELYVAEENCQLFFERRSKLFSA